MFSLSLAKTFPSIQLSENLAMLRVLAVTVSFLSLLSAMTNQRSKFYYTNSDKIAFFNWHITLCLQSVGTSDDDIGNIQLVSTIEDHGLYNIRPELKENLLKQGITSLEEAGYLENERKTQQESKALIAEEKLAVVKPPRRIIFHPVPVYRYVPYWRHSVSHHVSERHRHFFYWHIKVIYNHNLTGI